MAQEKSVTPSHFWRDKNVLLTGHTGFKGAWMALLLHRLGAKITGISLKPDTTPSLWILVEPHLSCASHIIDIRNEDEVRNLVAKVQPEICIHMAAQALVPRGYQQPLETFATNVMGTVNVLEALRHQPEVQAIVVVTSDKVYRNDNKGEAFFESSPLGGSDPYSASKAACEHVAYSYAESFFAPRGVALATARGGNVIGGGDWSQNRLVPDIYRALSTNTPLELRYPQAIRPWQHVLDCVSGYLYFAQYLLNHKANHPASLNFGPQETSYLKVSELAEAVTRHMGKTLQWKNSSIPSLPEKSLLSLNSREATGILGWQPRLTTAEAIRWTGEWYGAFTRGEDAYKLVNAQLDQYAALGKSYV